MATAIESQLNNRLKEAMKARDNRVLNVIRAIRSKVGEAKTAKNFSGEVNDELYLKVIAAYVKSMTKAAVEFEKVGEKGADKLEQLQFEINYLNEYLPKKLDEAATREIVVGVIAETGASAKKDIGRVMGAVMKSHRDQVDAAIVRSIADSLLTD